jgi:hypothetical protein
MSRTLVFELYLGIGLATAAWVALRKEGWAMRVAAVPLWPFLLPALMGAGDGERRATPAEGRLDELARRVAECWARGPAPSVEGRRERQILEGFVARLRQTGQRIAEIEGALAQAPERAQAPLRAMATAATAELETGTELLEELLAQLVLLRFAASPTAAGLSDRARVEGLLARIESVVSVQTGT